LASTLETAVRDKRCSANRQADSGAALYSAGGRDKMKNAHLLLTRVDSTTALPRVPQPTNSPALKFIEIHSFLTSLRSAL
jgi:hypothetical protein